MNEILNLINNMSPYLLLGFFLAGIMHAFIPARLYQRHLGKPTLKSVLYSTMIAIPLPLCSCGVIPTAMSLRKDGASKGSVISFLIATPQTGVDSILATYSLMGLPFAVVRPIAALVTALFGGILTNSLDSKLKDNSDKNIAIKEVDESKSFLEKMKIALRYSFFDMMQDIGKWLVVGLFIAGLITLYVPDSYFQMFADNTLLSILVVLLCAIPMYLCATGSIPIAIALMLKGLSPGAALVLLMAGPAVNVASILVIRKVMGTRTLIIYLFSIIIGATCFALFIDYLLPRDLFMAPLIANSASCHAVTPLFKWVSTILLFVLLINALARRFFVRKKEFSGSCCSGQTCSCSSSAADQSSDREFLIKVEGMKCNHCKANVEKAVAAVAGVEEAEADLQSGNVLIKGHFDMESVVLSVEDLGFKVVEHPMPKENGSVDGKDKSEETILHVKGMKCNHCKANVEKAVSQVDGVEFAEADLQSGNVLIKGDFDLKTVISSIEDLGFTVEA